MPRLKEPRLNEPLWKQWDHLADKDGLRHTVYAVNGDEYTGEWKGNKRHGRGTHKSKSSSTIYEGDWKGGKRNGFGVLSILVDGNYKKQYSGGWKNDKRHGYGENWYSESDYYEGEWYADKRSGWGRMYFADGSVYEGEWYDDQRSGQGMQRLSNDNRYEGSWKNGKKNGPGKFYYLDTGQLLEGVWVDDVAKCGQMTDFGREGAPEPTEFAIPEVKLKNANQVLEEAKNHFMDEEEF